MPTKKKKKNESHAGVYCYNGHQKAVIPHERKAARFSWFLFRQLTDTLHWVSSTPVRIPSIWSHILRVSPSYSSFSFPFSTTFWFSHQRTIGWFTECTGSVHCLNKFCYRTCSHFFLTCCKARYWCSSNVRKTKKLSYLIKWKEKVNHTISYLLICVSVYTFKCHLLRSQQLCCIYATQPYFFWYFIKNSKWTGFILVITWRIVSLPSCSSSCSKFTRVGRFTNELGK